MSIIYDALKKVEQSGIGPLKAKVQQESSRQPTNKINRYLVYLLFLALGLFCANLFFSFFIRPAVKPRKEENKPIQSKIPEQAPKQDPLPASPVVLPPPSVNKPTLSLNGIFFSGSDSYALINNQIVKINDKIGGAVVKDISTDKVLLDLNGSEIKLTTAG